MSVTLEDIREAARGLEGLVHHTPLLTSHTLDAMVGSAVFLKAENLQRTGSFKIRGAYHCLRKLGQTDPHRAVVTASAGNHAQGLALASGLTGRHAIVFMPVTAPLAKVEATLGYGAEVRLEGQSFDEAVAAAQTYAQESGAAYISAFDHDDIITGQGTVALEILGDRPDIDTVVVPVGGGGLISGMAIALKETHPRIRVLGVQAEGASSLVASRRAGSLTPVPTVHTIADGIAIKHPSERTFGYIQRYVDELVTVSDEEIARTIVLLLERTKLIVEGAGAAALAALINARVSPGQRSAVVLSGGNIDTKLLSTLIEHQMLAAHRYVRLMTMVGDRPGGLVRVLQAIAEERGNLIEVTHHRVSTEVPIGMTGIELQLEVRDQAHGEAILARLRSLGCTVTLLP